MRLLAIPNDATSSYFRNDRGDFLSEFNPKELGGKRFFEQVCFINWKDLEDVEYEGIKSFAILKDKTFAINLVKDLGSGKSPFIYPLFTDFFLEEKDSIIKIAKEIDASLIRSFNADHAAELGLIIREELKIPLVISVHNMPRVTDTVKEADSLVCISECLRDKCIKEYRVNPERIALIPDGVDMNFFNPKKENEINNVVDLKYHKKYKILSVGRINPQKNLGNLLESIKYIKDELKNVCHLHLGIGTLEDTKKIIELKNSLGLNNVSYFLGGKQKRELPFYYSWADTTLFPSIYEGLGRVSIESLACGVPVVTTNYAPMNEVVKDNYNGLTADPQNPFDISLKTIEILTNDNLRNSLSKKARESVREKYGVDFVMQQHCDNYEKLIKKDKIKY